MLVIEPSAPMLVTRCFIPVLGTLPAGCIMPATVFVGAAISVLLVGWAAERIYCVAVVWLIWRIVQMRGAECVMLNQPWGIISVWTIGSFVTVLFA
jgi:uncharacterized MAPEG superfamily protein